MLSYEAILGIHKAALRDQDDPGVLNPEYIQSAIGQPYQTFDGADLYVGPIAKAAALCFFLAKAHGFADGNKRVGFIAMKVALFANGYHLVTDPDDGEFMILSVVEGEADLEELTIWVEEHIEPTQANALIEIATAMPPFFDSLNRQTKFLDQYLDRIKAHTRERKILFNTPSVRDTKREQKINRAAASDTRALNEKLKKEVSIMRESAQIIEENAPHFPRWMELSIPIDKDFIFDILLNFGDLVDSSYAAIDRVDVFLQNLAVLRTASIELDRPCADLIETIEDVQSIFNQSWFSYKDLVEGLKTKLNNA